MKKIIIGFLVILVGIFVALTFVGKKGGHDAEKVLWDLNQEFNKFAADPKASPENAYVSLGEKYVEFLEKYPDAEVTPGAHIVYARLMVLKEDFEKAIDIYNDIISKYPENKSVNLEALLELARVQIVMKNDLGVLDTYQRVIASHPTSEVGLKTPLLVAQFYLDRKQDNLMNKAFDEAVVHYKKLVDEEKGSVAGFYALQYLSVCYIAQKNWEGALETYEQSLVEYSDLNVWTPDSLLKLLRAFNTISATQRKSLDYPIGVYQKFIEEKPEHPFVPVLQRVTTTLEELKAKGAISPETTIQSLQEAVVEVVEENAQEEVEEAKETEEAK